jgi:hypothetical protein
VETQRWINQSHPQTLVIGTFLLYLDGAFGLLDLLLGGFAPLLLIVAGGAIAAGYGIANDRNWGYYLGIAVSALGVLLSLGDLIRLMFAIAQIALLVHPMSRSYQKVWFR